jgi:hypothetical protein
MLRAETNQKVDLKYSGMADCGGSDGGDAALVVPFSCCCLLGGARLLRFWAFWGEMQDSLAAAV